MSLHTSLTDVRFAFRTLHRDAAFSLLVILIAGLGIGASVTVFSVLHTLLLRPLPFAEADRLVWIANRDTGGLSERTTQVGHMVDLRERARSLQSLAGYNAFYGVGDQLLSGTGEPERLNGVAVTVNFFDVLGVQPQLGRFFTDDEGAWNAPRAIVLSDGLWRRRFAADPAILGRALTLNDRPHTVVGVLPASFDFGTVFAPGQRFDVYRVFPLAPQTDRWGNTLAMVGRLMPGVTAAEARAEIQAIARQLVAEHPRRNTFAGDVVPLREMVTAPVRTAVWVLAAAVGMVMLIVCANVSNLLLSRAAVRQKEFAIRSALGAGRGRLIAQLLAESLVLSGAGAIVGLGLAIAGTRALASLDAVSIPLLRDVRVDAVVLAFTVAVATAAGIVFGLAPALLARSGPLHESLKDATRGSTEGRQRRWIRGALVVSEIAFACVLLVGAGLLIRSFIRVLDVELGFEPARATAIRIDPDRRYATPEQQVAYIDEALRRVREIPGVEAAAITDALPLGSNRTWGVRAAGMTDRGDAPQAFVRIVSDGYPMAMGLTLMAGRDIASTDTAATEPVIVVNRTMAQTLWPGEDPIGKVVLNACAEQRRVVGVVADVRHLALEHEAGNEMYIPMRQCRDRATYDLVVRSSIAAAPLAGVVRERLKPIAPNLPPNEFRTLEQIVERALSPRRFTVLLLTGFAAFALVLASLGIYALISYSVSQRVQEIGIRMALGATAADVKRQIMAQTLALAGLGIIVGAAASWAVARGLDALLFEVRPEDPWTFAAMVVLLVSIAAIAGYLPARRASSIDPMVALRAQ